MSRPVFFNGQFTTVDRALVPVEDRGFQLGDGIYEVVRVYGGRPFALGQHLARLEESARAIELPLPYGRAELAAILQEVVDRSQLAEALLYLQVTRGVAPRSHAFPAQPVRPTVVAYASPVPAPPPDLFGEGVACIVVPDERWGLCHIKSTNLLANVLAKEKARRAGAHEALFHREGIGITDGASSNVFCVLAGRLVTPAADRYILGGVTRAMVLDLAREACIPVEERRLGHDELARADEVLLTGTTTEVAPVTRVDKLPVGDGRPGPIALSLARAFQERVRREIHG